MASRLSQPPQYLNIARSSRLQQKLILPDSRFQTYSSFYSSSALHLLFDPILLLMRHSLV